MTRPLVIGVGNPGRGDDGVGPAVAAGVGQDPRAAGAVVRSVVQLTPELAAEVAEASVVVIADARVGGAAGAVHWGPVGASESGVSGPFSHHLTPAALCHLAGTAFGRVPPTFVVGVGAFAFDAGAPLSAPARAAVPRALEVVVALATGARPSELSDGAWAS